MSGSTDPAPGEPAAWRAARDVLRSLPTGIWVLGLGSMLMDTSSESVHSLLPVFMTVVLRSSVVTIGVVEGIAEATAAITRVFSGALSDYLGCGAGPVRRTANSVNHVGREAVAKAPSCGLLSNGASRA
jgi:hypothetical protein